MSCLCGAPKNAAVHAVTHPATRDMDTHVFGTKEPSSWWMDEMFEGVPEVENA